MTVAYNTLYHIVCMLMHAKDFWQEFGFLIPNSFLLIL